MSNLSRSAFTSSSLIPASFARVKLENPNFLALSKNFSSSSASFVTCFSNSTMFSILYKKNASILESSASSSTLLPSFIAEYMWNNLSSVGFAKLSSVYSKYSNPCNPMSKERIAF